MLPLQLPDFKDQESMQRFFLQEVQKGEELLAEGVYTRQEVVYFLVS